MVCLYAIQYTIYMFLFLIRFLMNCKQIFVLKKTLYKRVFSSIDFSSKYPYKYTNYVGYFLIVFPSTTEPISKATRPAPFQLIINHLEEQ